MSTKVLNLITFVIAVVLMIAVLSLPGCNKGTPESADASSGQNKSQGAPASVSGKKVLFVDSYHKGYPWSEGIVSGLLDELHVRLDENDVAHALTDTVELKVVRMDTKRNTSEEFIKQAAQRTKTVIDSWKPDLVIVADDNASKYVVVPYFRNTKTPFVFCGVNWDCSAYGLPCSNVTGMLEVSLIRQLLTEMGKYAAGSRIGLLGADNLSNHKEAEHYRSRFNISLEKEVFVETFEEWKSAFIRIQDEVDMLIIAPPSFLKTAEEKAAAAAFAAKHTAIPTGCVEDWITPYALIGFAKASDEQGRWAGRTALRILGGRSPADIPVVTNTKARIHLNMTIARKLKVVFPMKLIESSELITSE
ncbi:MAG: ABC transporter substrate binding protein [Phycisphaerae bacterium]|nr:ABC transporter substrate binding protein [Phycisphaerae bacterium]